LRLPLVPASESTMKIITETLKGCGVIWDLELWALKGKWEK
jgi:hypothetical protein